MADFRCAVNPMPKWARPGSERTGCTGPAGSHAARRLADTLWPLFQIEAAGGQFVLAALAAPEDRYDEVTQIVNAQTEVAINYRREHALNMWFVVAAESPQEAQAV